LSSIISAVMTIFFMVPLLGFIIIYFLYKMITKNSLKSFHVALDLSTVLFILAVHFLTMTIWGESFFWLIAILLIIIAMVFVVVHWKVKGEIVLNKVFKGFWRFNFLIFFLAYITLTFYGLLHRALTFTFS
jgi:CDP-diglyceride synthetase